MRSRLLIAAAVSIAVTVFNPAAASAAVEFGDNCVGDEGTSTATLTTLEAHPGPLSLTAPTSGVITKVRIRIGLPLPFRIPQQVKVLRSAGVNSFTTIADTVVEAGAGLTTADARMPVQTGDRLGVHGLPFTYEGSPSEGAEIYCDEEPGGRVGGIAGDVPVGSTATYVEGPPNTRLPLTAVIEPDADNDGFGDETQDACPQSAAVQTPCPVITLDAIGQPRAGAVTVLVTASSEVPVSVNGVVNLGKGKKATLKAAPKAVSAGKLVRFTLKFSPKLKKRLQELEPSKKLTLKITASATNIAGQVSTDQTKAKLKGQA